MKGNPQRESLIFLWIPFKVLHGDAATENSNIFDHN